MTLVDRRVEDLISTLPQRQREQLARIGLIGQGNSGLYMDLSCVFLGPQSLLIALHFSSSPLTPERASQFRPALTQLRFGLNPAMSSTDSLTTRDGLQIPIVSGGAGMDGTAAEFNQSLLNRLMKRYAPNGPKPSQVRQFMLDYDAEELMALISALEERACTEIRCLVEKRVFDLLDEVVARDPEQQQQSTNVLVDAAGK